MKFKIFKFLILCFMLQTMPFITNASNCSQDHKKYHKQVKTLSLKDFAGRWVFNINSLGGISGPSAIGTSSTIDGQLSFNDSGIGTVNFVSRASYSGTVGDVSITTLPFGSNVTINIIDPKNGICTLTITESSLKTVIDTAEVMVTRSILTGEAIRLDGHSTAMTPETSNVKRFTFSRQYQ